MGQGEVDIDALIAGSDPVTAEVVQPVKKESSKEKKKTKTAKAPWEGVGKGSRRSLPLYLDEEGKLMLDFIRDTTEVPTQRFLKKVLAPAIRKEAERLWKEQKGY